jgi:rfaE bifunctional protein nucleotidyltransferase chain/domain
MYDYRNKILNQEEAIKIRERIRLDKKTFVFTNGCFDILHPGHTRYLWESRNLGDYLLVAVNTDSSVKRLKGHLRPVFDEQSRTEMLSAFEFVDGVILFDEDTPYDLIKKLVPDVLVKGGDWPDDKIVGYDVVKEAGGTVKSITFQDGYSTTGIIDKIVRMYGK